MQIKMKRLDGRVAVITGAGQGIGGAIAVAMAGEGASVVIADVNGEMAGKMEMQLAEALSKALAIAIDLSGEESVNAMIQGCLDAYGRIDILVNNAGIFPISSVEEMSEEEWDRVIRTNLTGTFLCSRAVIPHLLQQRWGRIINFSSGTALQGAKNGAHYAASKGGIIGFTKALALELAPYGITANAICPGLTDTAQPRRHRTEEELRAIAQTIPLGRIGQPTDLVGPAIFLASDAARFVTGQTIVVNGGAIMW